MLRSLVLFAEDKPLDEPKCSLIDYVMKLCGTTVKDFWKADIDKIVFDIFLDNGPLEPAARLYWRNWDITYAYKLSTLTLS